MSRDSSRTYIHLHKPHHADLFEEFTSLNPITPSSLQSNPGNGGGPAQTAIATAHPSLPSAQIHLYAPSTAPIHNPTPLGNTPHLAPEDILVHPQHQPPNPEDEDDVVPDQHAAFGITRAMALAESQRNVDDAWRDFESLRERVRGEELQRGAQGNGGPTVQQRQQQQENGNARAAR